MIDSHEPPISFTMELAQHSDALSQFAKLSETEHAAIVNGAKEAKSRDEMCSAPSFILIPSIPPLRLLPIQIYQQKIPCKSHAFHRYAGQRPER